jgi:hypothetical protein
MPPPPRWKWPKLIPYMIKAVINDAAKKSSTSQKTNIFFGAEGN